jgi:capsule polysaccharide export protein KpsE/RkpR
MVTRFDLLKLYRDKYMEDARRDLEKKSQIDVDKKAGIIAVSVEDHLPARASSMAQAYVDEVNALFSSVNTSSAHRERVFVEDRLRDIGLELSAAEKEFSEFASQNNAIDIPQQAKATVEGAAQLQAELMAAQTRLAGLKQIYAPQNARVRDLQAQVVELQHQLEKLDGKNVNPSSGTTPGNDELYPSLRQLPLLGVKYLDLYRRNRVDEAVFELLSKQLEIARIDEAKDIPSLKIMDPPAIPERKSFPHRLWIILSGVTLGFVGISTWVVAREAWLRIDPCDPWKVLATEVYVWLQHALLENKVALGIRVWASRITRSRAASMASSSQPNG